MYMYLFIFEKNLIAENFSGKINKKKKWREPGHKKLLTLIDVYLHFLSIYI